MTRADLDVIPLARPVIGAREEELVLEVLRSGQLSLGPRVPAFEAAFAARLGVAPRLRGLVRHDRAAPRAARGRRGGGRRGRHVAVLVRRLGQRGPLRGRAAGVRRHRPRHAQPATRTPRRPRSPSARARCCRSTSSATRPTSPPWSATASRSSRTPARRSAPCTRTARRWAAAGTRRSSASTPTSRSPPARAAWSSSAPRSTACGSTPSATRAARPTWAGSTTTGSASTTGSPTSRARSGSPSSSGSTTCSPPARRWRRGTREALAGLAAERGLALPCPDAGGDVRGWFVYVVQLPHGVDRDATLLALRELGVQSKPYLPAIHLMSFYRERFGHRPGEFPVCEDVAERSLALPFFPGMTQDQVAPRGGRARARSLT